jgi:hypothetical protein
MSPKIIPQGHKQITLILPDSIIEKLDKICEKENRKRPGQVQHWIEKEGKKTGKSDS